MTAAAQITVKAFEELSNQELYEILTLRSDVFLIEQNSLYRDCDGNDNLARHMSATADGMVIGCLRLLPAGVLYDNPSIGRFALRKEWRGKGIAKAMMKLALEHLRREWQAEAVTISAQAYLRDFYGSFGFNAISEEFLEDGIPHLYMRCNLDK